VANGLCSISTENLSYWLWCDRSCLQDFNKAKIMLLWYVLEGKGGEHNSQFKSFSFNFYSWEQFWDNLNQYGLPVAA